MEVSLLQCRFLWVVQYFVGAGFYVIPSYSPQDHSVDNTVASTPGIFLRNWANLWSSITDTATFKCVSDPCMFSVTVSLSQSMGSAEACWYCSRDSQAA